MANNFEINQTVDLKKGINGVEVWPHALMYTGDKNAHTWNVTILDGGTPATISGNVMGYFIRKDGATVAVKGSLSGNVASVTLDEKCYAFEGDVRSILRITTSNSIISVSALLLNVRYGITDEIVDPGKLVPTLDELLAQIDAMEKATANAEAAASKSVRYDIAQSLTTTQKRQARENIETFTNYVPASTPFDVWDDMSALSTYMGTPDKFTGLGDAFIWPLGANYSYRIVKFNNNMILIGSPSTSTNFLGTRSNAGVASWNRLESEDLLLSNRDVSNPNFVPFIAYSPSVNVFDVWNDMPNMSTYIGYPTKFNGMGDSFRWELRSASSYRIVKFNDNMMMIASPSTDEIFIGSRSNAGDTFWNKLFVDDINITSDAVQVYTNPKFIDEYSYSRLNPFDTPSGNVRATELLPAMENTVYYHRFPNYSAHSTVVVFFDRYKRPISYLSYSDYETYEYQIPDGSGERTENYVTMKKFKTPIGTRYFGFNFSIVKESLKYFCISNVPLMWIGGAQPDLVIKEGDPKLQKRNKTLCVIGTSGTMIDRLYRSDAGDYISGYQEYFWPYYKDVISYGYSSTAYSVGLTPNYGSVYEYITTGYNGQSAKDFSNVDEVLIIGQNANGFTNTNYKAGDVGNYTLDTVDPTTFIGAIRGIIQYILAQNPKCKIYITSFYKNNNSIKSIDKILDLNAKIKELSEVLGLTYIDLWGDLPFNYSNYSADNLVYTYDGGHANSAGNMMIAEVILKYMIN